jgi:hypothetical protein
MMAISDYIVKDSSLLCNANAFSELDRRYNSIYMGIVRREEVQEDGEVKYLTEAYVDGIQVMISCQLMTRWGGVYNFEEYKPKSWARDVSDDLLPPGSSGSYSVRDGDVVIIAMLGGDARNGVILGSLRHSARKEKIEEDARAYISSFNGLETTIDNDGAYTVKFQGTPLQDLAPSVPGNPITEPKYDPIKTGSYFGFTSDGSYTVSDGSQYIKIAKNKVTGSITLVSGKNKIVMGGNPTLGEISITTDTVSVDSLNTSIKAKKDVKVEGLNVSLKGAKMAIGNDAFELFDGLGQLIDALGTLIVTSPVGSCTPLSSAPTWASSIVPLKAKIASLKSTIVNADTPKEQGGALDEPGSSGLLT